MQRIARRRVLVVMLLLIVSLSSLPSLVGLQAYAPADSCGSNHCAAETSPQTTPFAGLHRPAPLLVQTESAGLGEAFSLARRPASYYDVQLGITFTQSFAYLAYNVTAVAQSDVNGYGPGYLLNGLSNQGYWYQVGISWNWPYTSGGYTSGFHMNYEAFDTSGNSVFPASGGGGLTSFNGAVNGGDSVLLSLSFSGGNVVMYAFDWNTGASAQQAYTAHGATTFVGQTGGPDNGSGYFTGLMTEWWHSTASMGTTSPVIYTNSTTALSSGWLWADEWNPNRGVSVFSDYRYVAFSDPSQLQYFSTNGTAVAANGYELITGAVPEVPVTFSFSVVGGGVGYSSPILTYVSNGSTLTATLASTPQIYSLDVGSTRSVNATLPGSGPTERWAAGQATSATAQASQTVSISYYHQFSVAFGFAVDRGSGFAPPKVTYAQFGSVHQGTANFTDWADSSSGWSYPLDLTGPTQLWLAQPPSSGSITSSGPVTVLYLFKENTVVQVAVGLTLLPSAGSAGLMTSNYFQVTYVQGGSQLTANDVGSNPFMIYADNGTVVAIAGASSQSGASEKWILSGSSSPTSISLGNTAANYTFYFYDVLLQTQRYNTLGGGSPGLMLVVYSTAPDVAGPSDAPKASSIALTGVDQTYWGRRGSSVTINQTVAGSAGERWSTPTSSWSISTANQVTNPTPYYHQFNFTYSYSVSGGGSPTAPSLTATQFGSAYTPTLTGSPTAYWLDSSQSWSVTNPLVGSGATERWQTTQGVTGAVSGAATTIFMYYHQFKVFFSFNVSGGSGYSPPEVSFTQYGANTSALAGSSAFVDAQSAYIFQSLLPGSDQSQKWVATQSSPSGVVTASSTETVTFNHQYFVTVDAAQAGGTVSPAGGWFDEGHNLQLSATASAGWQFEYWIGSGDGSYNGTAPQASAVVSSAITESAVFYAGLTIRAADYGTVRYDIASGSGTVQGGTSETFYAPVGSTVTVEARPSPFLFEFGGWTGAAASTSQTTAFSLTAPTAVGASFSLDFVNVVIALAAVAVGLAVAWVIVRYRRRPASSPLLGNPPPADAPDLTSEIP